MVAKNILLTQINISPGSLERAREVWKGIYGDNQQHRLYTELNENHSRILMISEVNNINGLDEIIFSSDHLKFEQSLKDIFVGDWRRQYLRLKESIKSLDTALPNTEYLQLRHIEVPLCVYEEYLQWRQKTIFQHVKKQPEIDFFLAYHSVLSTEPGVMFLSGFSCQVEEYLTLFDNKTYKNIVKEAGKKYIAGGEKGLYIELYKLA